MPDQRPLTDADVVAPMPEPEGEAGGGEPSTRTIKTPGGKELEVSKEIAQAWEERDRLYQQGITQQGGELGELRREIAELRRQVSAGGASRPAAEEATDEQYYEKLRELSYEDPVAAEKLREERIEKRYAADQARRSFQETWRRQLDAFYADNPDLAKDEDLVDLTYHRLVRTDPAVREMVTTGRFPELLERVGDETRKRILSYGGKAREYRPTSRGGRVAITESGDTTRGQRSAPADEDEGPKTMADAIKAKQARHKGAHSSRPPGQRDYRPKPTAE